MLDDVMRRSGLTAGLFPLSLLWSFDSGKLICCHLVYCPHYLKWSGLSWASVRIWVSSTVRAQARWRTSTCGEPERTLTVIFCRIEIRQWDLLVSGENWRNSFRAWQVSDVLRLWQLYDLVSLRKPERSRLLIANPNCHANEHTLIREFALHFRDVYSREATADRFFLF